MRFDRDWTAFALDAEYDSFGHQRIAKAHNALRASVAEKDAEIARLRAKVEKAEALAKETEAIIEDPFAHHGRLVAALRASIASAQERIEELEKAVGDFLVKYDECEPHVIGAFAMAFTVRGNEYKGPNWGAELSALRDAREARRG